VRRFDFRLQRVLQWQQKICRLEEDKFRLCQSDFAQAEAKIARLAAECAAIEREFSTEQRLAPTELRALAEFRRKSVSDAQTLEKERQDRLTALNAQRQKLLSARRRLEVIEKLRERALHEYTREADRELEALSHESYLSTWLARR